MLITDDDIYHTGGILDYINENKKILNCRSLQISAGQHIYKQGQDIENILFITQGLISLHRSSVHGRRYQLGTFAHNGSLGLMELFSAQPCFYTVIAESDINAYIVNASAFSTLVYNTPELAACTFKHLTSKWYLSVERMTRNILHSIKFCVIDDLLQFAKSNPEQEYKINKSLECERLGTTIRVYNRILKRLSGIGAITVNRRHIEIIDTQKLQQELTQEEQR